MPDWGERRISVGGVRNLTGKGNSVFLMQCDDGGRGSVFSLWGQKATDAHQAARGLGQAMVEVRSSDRSPGSGQQKQPRK